MKTMKKIAVVMMAICLLIPGFSMVTQAASGQIQFTDHADVKTGDKVDVTCAVKAAGATALEDVEVEIKYDTTALKFISGGGVTEKSSGVLGYAGRGTEKTLRFVMQFEALKVGTTQLTVGDYSAFLTTDEKVTCTKGTSTITIAQGSTTSTPATTPAGDGANVTVNSVDYTIETSVPQEQIPEGYVATKVQYEGKEYTFVKNDKTDFYLAYLKDAEGNGKLFLYSAEDATFMPYQTIQISSSTTIVLLSDASAITMPEEFTEIVTTYENQEYPAWQKNDDLTRWIVYAMNSEGQASLYQFDSAEGTYQRFDTPEVVEAEKDDSTISKLQTTVNESFEYFTIVIGILLALGLVLIIVLAVKLHNRNLELDDLYDEYGIDLEDSLPDRDEKKHSSYEEEEDDGIHMEDLAYEDEEDDLTFVEEEPEEEIEIPEVAEPEEELDLDASIQTMKKEDSDFEDFDFDLIDLDDLDI